MYLCNLYGLNYDAALLFFIYNFISYRMIICINIQLYARYLYVIDRLNVIPASCAYFILYVENITFRVTSCYDYFNDLL